MGETKRKKELLYLLRVILRDALLQNALSTTNSVHPHTLLRVEETRIRAVAERFSPATLLFAQGEVSGAELHAFFNANFPQCLELLIAKILQNNAENQAR